MWAAAEEEIQVYKTRKYIFKVPQGRIRVDAGTNIITGTRLEDNYTNQINAARNSSIEVIDEALREAQDWPSLRLLNSWATI